MMKDSLEISQIDCRLKQHARTPGLEFNPDQLLRRHRCYSYVTQR